MALEVKIPPMGESISSGVLAKWHVNDGDTVKKDQPLFELETDKITSEGTAEAAGKISLQVAAGAEVKIGQVVASIDPAASSQKPEVSPSLTAAAPAPTSDVRPLASSEISPAVRRLATETGVNPATVAGSGKDSRVTKGDMLAASAAPAAKPAAPAAASSPLAPAPPPSAIRRSRPRCAC